MSEVILTASGNVDWRANGWPVPNHSWDDGGHDLLREMPPDVYNEWDAICSDLELVFDGVIELDDIWDELDWEED